MGMSQLKFIGLLSRTREKLPVNCCNETTCFYPQGDNNLEVSQAINYANLY